MAANIDENPAIGVILYKEKSDKTVKYALSIIKRNAKSFKKCITRSRGIKKIIGLNVYSDESVPAIPV